MKVLLVVPPRISKRVVHIVQPIGLGYLATSLLRAGIECSILDCVKETIGADELMRHVDELNPDVVGFNFFSNNWDAVANCSRLIRENHPDILILAGGAHPSVLPRETLKEIQSLDLVFIGEAEESLVKMCLRWQETEFRQRYKHDPDMLKDILGIAWRKNDGDIQVRKCYFREDINEFGMPAWDLIQPHKYPLAPHGVFPQNYPLAPIITSRGCPYPCTFCAASTTMGKKIRYRSHELVMEEVLLLKNHYGIREIQIVDDNFTFRKEYAMEFCQRAIRMNLSLSFGLPNGIRLNTLDDELLSLMRRAGFYSIVVGIESGSPRILKIMKKKLELEQIREKIDLIKRHGLGAEGFFILGFPGETREDMEMTINFARSLKLDRAFFGNYVPLPGTQIYNELVNSGEISNLDWSKVFVGGSVIYSPKGITPQELERIQKRAFFKFYLTPRRFIEFVTKLRLRNIRGILKRVLFTFWRA